MVHNLSAIRLLSKAGSIPGFATLQLTKQHLSSIDGKYEEAKRSMKSRRSIAPKQ